MILMQFSTAIDLLITTIYWLVLAPMIIYYILNPPKDGLVHFRDDDPSATMKWPMTIYQIVLQITHHTIPLAVSLMNIHLTDMRLLPQDYKLMFLMGLTYIPFDYMGFKIIGKGKQGIYPFDLWNVSVPLTLCIHVFICCCTSYSYYRFASSTARKPKAE